jgi:PAS domain S-box-containing protein
VTQTAALEEAPDVVPSSGVRRWRVGLPLVVLVVSMLGLVATPVAVHLHSEAQRSATAAEAVRPAAPPGSTTGLPPAGAVVPPDAGRLRVVEAVALGLMVTLALLALLSGLALSRTAERLRALNARHHVRLHREAALRRAARSLSAAGDLATVLQEIAERGVEITEADGACVAMVLPGGGEMEIRATVGADTPGVGDRLPFPGDLEEHAGAGRDDPVLLTAPSQGHPADALSGFPSGATVLAAPLGSERRALGVLWLVRDRRRPGFSPDEVHRTHALADLASLALRRILLLQSTERERRAKHALLESTGEGIYGIDPQGRCTFLNRAGARLLGYRPEEVLGRDLYALAHQPPREDAPPTRESPLQSALRSGRGVRVEDATLWRSDGTSFPAIYSSYPLVEDGEIRGVVVSFADITERKRVETALRESEQRFRLLYDDNPSMYLILDSEGRFVSTNRYAEERLGYEEGELIGQPALTTVHPPDGGVFLRHFFATLRNAPHVQRTEVRRVRKDGTVFWVQETARAAQDLTGTPVVLTICEDITALREAEEERARLLLREQETRTAAEEAVLARDEVLGLVTHDLRNPLGTISMAASMLLDVPLPDRDRERHLNVIRRSAERMNRLIQDLLDATRMERGKLPLDTEPLPVPSLVQEAYETLAPLAAEKGVRLCTSVPERLPKIRGDRDRILQVVSNLVGNALKFTGEGGEVSLSAERTDGAVVFTVRDTGPGIAPEHLEHLFDRFWQADGTAHLGAGLGLTIARGIVEAHEGEIRVESAEGEGSAFHFTIPVVGA